MAFTKKIAGWVAGRIKGEQARKDTMRWMEKTGLGMILDAAGDYALTQGALKGAGKLKGLLTGGGQAAAPLKALPAPGASTTTIAPRTASAIGAPGAAPAITPTAVPAAPMKALVAPGAGSTAMAPRAASAMVPPTPRPMQSMVAPAPAPAPAPTGGMTPQMRGAAQRAGGLENVANANVAGGPGGFRGFMQGAKEYAPLIQATAGPVANVIGQRMEQSLEEEKMKREQDARNRMAMLLMPMFQSQLQQYGQLYGQPLPPLGGR
jgi:hypothetical protein